ncbi:alpha/beta hydrolase [Amycolatopsis rifamycinica]|uniref:Alpha/beta hydrolase n=1 Tax=Amycolatopsis rifamycinica TaxID=287986 RepID=A0A066TVC5_9PSEU|nr:alpha/beta hydrolase [Amycolatopsis rifamycinica]KDN15968.1 alpha/beta hydrolase [Amycolatopsis rifamycinica]
MSAESTVQRPPEPDWLTMTDEELFAYRDAENRFRASAAARAFTGEPHPGVVIEWRDLPLPGRELPVRVYRPAEEDGVALPLVVHVHGGGFVGTAVQSDWINSHLAARLPSVVVSVEHRLVAPEHPLADAVDDGWDALRHLAGAAGTWGIDPDRVAVAGESCGGLISALAAIRARDAGLRLRAQVLVNPAVDATAAMFGYPSVTEYAHTPTLGIPVLRLFQRLAVPPGTDARALSPVHAEDLSGLAPALVVVPTHDPLADHGRRYAERLAAAGTPARLSEYAGAGHAFLSTPGLAPQAETAAAEILGFLGTSFAAGAAA